MVLLALLPSALIAFSSVSLHSVLSRRNSLDQISYHISLLLSLTLSHGSTYSSSTGDVSYFNDTTNTTYKLLSSRNDGSNAQESMKEIFLICCYIPIFMSLFDLLLVRLCVQSVHSSTRAKVFLVYWTRHLPAASLSLVFISLLFFQVERFDGREEKGAGGAGGGQQLSEQQWLLGGFVSTFMFLLWRDRYKNITHGRSKADNNMGRIISNSLPLSIPSEQTETVSNVNEREWHNWNTRDTLDWIQSNLGGGTLSQTSHEEYETKREILLLLRVQRINGQALAYMTVERLCAMGLTFGDSVNLHSKIQVLMNPYSNPRSTTASSCGYYESSSNNNEEVHIDLDEWLGNKKKDPPRNDPVPSDDVADEPVDNGIHAPCHHLSEKDWTATPKIESAMELSDRIGVPFIQSPMQSHAKLPMHPNIVNEDTIRSSVTENHIDPKVLEQMPPNIREIAMRQPQLVQDILMNKRKSSGPDGGFRNTPGTKSFKTSADTAEQSPGRKHVHTKKTVSFALDATIAEDDESVGEEMVGLLRKRRS